MKIAAGYVLARFVNVYLNGELMRRVLAADSDAGTVECVDASSLLTGRATHHGTVEITLIPSAPAAIRRVYLQACGFSVEPDLPPIGARR